MNEQDPSGYVLGVYLGLVGPTFFLGRVAY